MSTPKRPWTPGPWMAEGRLVYALEEYGYRRGETQYANRFTAGVQGGLSCPAPELDANARFIAATPDLYEALEALANAAVRLSNDDVYHVVADEVEAARSALAKARGEEVPR